MNKNYKVFYDSTGGNPIHIKYCFYYATKTELLISYVCYFKIVLESTINLFAC